MGFDDRRKILVCPERAGGMISYFLYFAFIPPLRDFPWLNLLVVLLGLCLAALGLRNAFHPTRIWRAKTLGSLLLLMSFALAALFYTYVFILSYQLPGAANVLQPDAAAPDFGLPDQRGQSVKLADFAGRRVVISFYRGHW